jgi:hypothetical protein
MAKSLNKMNLWLPRATLLICVLSIPLALFFVPVSWLDGQNTICLFKRALGVECWGCGMTRATVSMAQLEFKRAVEYNWKIVIVFPMLCWIWLNWLRVCFFNFFKREVSND